MSYRDDLPIDDQHNWRWIPSVFLVTYSSRNRTLKGCKYCGEIISYQVKKRMRIYCCDFFGYYFLPELTLHNKKAWSAYSGTQKSQTGTSVYTDEHTLIVKNNIKKNCKPEPRILNFKTEKWGTTCRSSLKLIEHTISTKLTAKFVAIVI